MKRMTAWLMALCLIATCILPVRAMETNGTANEEEKKVQEEGEEALPDKSVTPSSSATPEDTEDTEDAEDAGDESGSEGADDKGGSKMEDGEKEDPDSEPEEDEDALQDSATEDGIGNEIEDGLTKTTLENTLEGDASWNEQTVSGSVTGGIEVVLMNALPIEEGSEIHLTVTLENGGGSKDVTLGSNSQKHMAVFDDLASGTKYRLRITEAETGDSGFGFLPYEQDIEVSGDIKTAEIYTGSVELSVTPDNADQKQPKGNPGIILIGDVNRDGTLGDEDKDAIMQAISNGTGGTADLNKDGRTDLVDLQFYTNSKAMLDAGTDITSSLTSRVSPKAVQVNVNPDSTEVTGNVENLLLDNGSSVTLQSKEGSISEDSPVEIGFNLQSDEAGAREMEQIVFSMGESNIASGTLAVFTDEGDELSYVIKDGKADPAIPLARTAGEGGQGENGTLVVDLRGQTAVKKITLRITGMMSNSNLAEISQVEFLNDMEKRIPEPEMNIPDGLTLTGGNKSFRVTWNGQVNVTGYEVKVDYNGQSEVRRVAANQLEVKSFMGGRLKNGELYEVCVQSINGTWESGYCESKTVSPVVSGKPDPPDNLKAAGGYRRVSLTWKNMEDTDYYNVYYKADGENAYTKIERVDQNRHVISNLKDETRYEVYVTGVNELGESNPSIHSEARTITLKPAQMPNYRLINESDGQGKISSHIESVTHGRGSMVGSSLDGDNKSALGTVDKDASSYYQVLDWDDGAAYPAASKGLLFTLDDYYEMSYIAFAEAEDIGWYSGAYVYYYDKEHPEGTAAQNLSLVQKTDGNGRKYYMIKLAQPITANKIRLGFTRGNNYHNIILPCMQTIYMPA